VPRFDDVRLETAEYRLLRELFNEHCGIVFGPEARPVVERRLRERLAALGLQSFSEYYQLLRYDERGRTELDEAIDLITINETYFFRENYQLRSYQTELLPMLRSGPLGRDRLSVWSAGCSTGEEVYSIAMLTRETGLFMGRSVRIFGSDISRRCVAAARRGVYGPSAFRATPPEFRKRYFIERQDGMHVTDELRAICQFGHINLLDVVRAQVVGRVDVIFCRNVLIYFDEASRRRVIEMFYDRLLPGGFLLLGHSESLLNITTAFELVHLREDLVYRKPLSATRFSVGAIPSPTPPPGPAALLSASIAAQGKPAAAPLAASPQGREAPARPGPAAALQTPFGASPGRAASLGRPGSGAMPPLGRPGAPPSRPARSPAGARAMTPTTPMPAVPPATRPAAGPASSRSPEGGPFKPNTGPRSPIPPGKPGPGTTSGGEPGDKR
jgi:chemotaxis protein methyltransferase CheR